MMENIITRIFNAMQSDDANLDKQSLILIEEYQNATPEQREVVDNVFIALCGWSLATLIDGNEY